MKKNRLYVISDIHLGGASSFQICRQRNQKRLAEFLEWLRTVHEDDTDDLHLVINGDLVDFLAEEPFSSFTVQQTEACNKLKRICKSSAVVWTALAKYVNTGHRLTILLGNHDLELSLPEPRRFLLEQLPAGRIEFIYDNQAFSIGPVLIEHGNRYDAWNQTPHDHLRRLRSCLSRSEAAPDFPKIPGNEMVTQVINPIKKTYGFVDLLKPENHAVLPLLALLDPSLILELRHVRDVFLKVKTTRFDAGAKPRDPGAIAISGIPVAPELVYLKKAEELAGFDPGTIGVRKSIKAFITLWQAAKEEEKYRQIDRLYEALRLFTDANRQAFDVNAEIESYIKPVKAAGRRGYKIVVYGHTHLAKNIHLKDHELTYLNTGTWVDLMTLPPEMFGSDEERAKHTLWTFADDLAGNHLEPWRRFLPTCARIDLDSTSTTVQDAQLFTFNQNHSLTPIQNGDLRTMM